MFVLFAKPVMIAAMEDVSVVALASWSRFKMKSYVWLASTSRSLGFIVSTYLEEAGQVRAVNLA